MADKPKDTRTTTIGARLPSQDQSSVDPSAYSLNASQLRERLAASRAADLKKAKRG